MKSFNLVHLTLYAKGAYVTTSLWDDLKSVLRFDGINESYYMTEEQLTEVILTNFQSLNIPSITNTELISRMITPKECWRFGYYTEDNCDFYVKDPVKYESLVAVVKYCLYHLNMLTIRQLGIREAIPSSQCLPLTKSITKSYSKYMDKRTKELNTRLFNK